jgi:D-tagatose-bisphosphate aldolase class II non-catalytic subunit
MSLCRLEDLGPNRSAGGRNGIPSVCTAHPVVIEAALRHAKERGTKALIEATCNQVNQDGGYTGMTPAAFRGFVEAIADHVGFDRNRLLLGGDHLGPNPWKHLDAHAAMEHADVMIAAYARAGFHKLHLDTSMGCRGESVALPDEITARRASHMASVAERGANDAGHSPPLYIVGTEVPIPGGALEAIEHLEVTASEAAVKTLEVHRRAFQSLDLDSAFERVVGLVVQPGIEFGHANVIPYRREGAKALSAVLAQMPQLVFEAHSTDYQTQSALSQLVEDGFAILKVGPGLTFALREALYGLSDIADILDPASSDEGLGATMERLMLRDPQNWRKYYHGDEQELRIQRHFSYSDRIRYYWPHLDAQAALSRLAQRLEGRVIPETLISQYLAAIYPDVASGKVERTFKALQIAAVQRVLNAYADAC